MRNSQWIPTPLLALFVLAGLAAPASSADDPGSKDYLKFRQSAKIVRPVDGGTLDTFVGTKTFEIRGTVRGSFRTDGGYTIMFERPDGISHVIEAPGAPDWLVESESQARLLVNATRPAANTAVSIRLLMAAPESDVKVVEDRYWQEQAKKAAAKKAAAARAPKSSSSRYGNGGRPALYGPIGRGNASPGPSRTWVVPKSEVTGYYAGFIKKRNPRLSDGECWRIAQAVIGFSLSYRVDARLVMAILLVESDFNPSSLSHAGAMGLGQLMPGTAKSLGVVNAWDTTQNLYGSVRYLAKQLSDFNRRTNGSPEALVLAIAAYNAGPGAVRRHGGVPPYRETQRYVSKVMGVYRQLLGYGK